jgi:Protein of unknown function (DUF1214)
MPQLSRIHCLSSIAAVRRSRALGVVTALVLGAMLGSSHAVAVDLGKPQNDWPNYTEVLAPYVARLPGLPSELKDPQLRAEMNAYVYAVAAQGFFGLVYQDARYPDFWPVFNQAFNFGFPCPDDAYYMAVIEDDGVYRISGYRGTVHILDFQIGTNLMQPYGMGPTTAGELSLPVAHYDLDRHAHPKRNGAFEVVLSPTRPAGHKGDWWELKKGARFILVRQRSYDWLGEVDGRLAIERLDVPASKPRMQADVINERLKLVGTWMENWLELESSFAIGMRRQNLVNTIKVIDQPGGVTGQKYLFGLFDLKPDEALILETELPKTCGYWSFHLTDEMMSNVDVMSRQSSLNGHQARVDRDGRFRAVIAERDPGVPNWLDTAGYAKGAMVGRWMWCSDHPQPTVKKVSLADVRSYLPAETPRVSAEKRDAALRLRRTGAQLRKRW